MKLGTLVSFVDHNEKVHSLGIVTKIVDLPFNGKSNIRYIVFWSCKSNVGCCDVDRQQRWETFSSSELKFHV